jgi:outer membrane protein assembly factor BamB
MRWIPLVIIILFAGTIIFMHATDHAGRYFSTDIGGAVIVLTSAIWFVATRSWDWRVKLIAMAVFALLPIIVKYDGSRSGSAAPSFSLRFAKAKDAGLEDLSRLKSLEPAAESSWKPVAYHRDFPGFLGPDRTGIIKDFELEPDWEEHPPEELWRRRIGLGWSGFAVKGRYAITQEQREELEMVTCYDLESGEPIWAHSNTARFSGGMGSDGPRATPQIDAELVYTLGATGIVDCLELATGELRWTRNVLAEHDSENVRYGKSGSPLIVDDFVVVAGGKSGPLLAAYHKLTGEPVWKAAAEPAGYAAPVLATIAGARQIVSVNRFSATGHEPTTGKELWRYDWPNIYPKPAQPQILEGDRVLLTASYGMGAHLLQLDRDGDAISVEELWESSRMKTKFSSVCIVDGYAYGLDEGRFACISLEDGSRQWKDGRYGYGQNFMIGDLIVVQAEQGEIILVRPNPAMLEELGRVKALSGKTWNYPTLAGSYLLVRNDEEAACFRLAVREPKG